MTAAAAKQVCFLDFSGKSKLPTKAVGCEHDLKHIRKTYNAAGLALNKICALL